MKMVNSDSEVTVLKNGGSGRSGSPITLNAPSNGGQASESSEDEREGRIRVGRDYQAVPPPYIPVSERRPEQCAERALLVWSPSSHIVNQKLDEFIQVAKEKYGYNSEQALGMLFWHKHDLDRALQDLANFTPFPDEWSVEDKVLFEQAFQFHGKSFHRIRQMLPDKSIAALVKYYYSWKKTRTRTSLMDRQARKLAVVREDGGLYGEETFPLEQGDKEGEKEVVLTIDATDDWANEERWSEAETRDLQEQLPAPQGDAHQPRRSCGPGNRPTGAGRGSATGFRQRDRQSQAPGTEQQTASVQSSPES